MKDRLIYKASALLLFIILFFTGLYFARNFLIPVVFAVLLAMLLLPLCKWLEKRLPRILSILICILLIISIVAGIIFLFYSQVVNFANDFEEVKEKLNEKLSTVQDYIESKTNVPAKEQMSWVKEKFSTFLNSSGSFVKSILMAFTEGVVTFGLILIYIFFFLLYRERFKNFILRLFTQEHHEKVEYVINNTKDLILKYLSGLLIALTILSVMNAIGLLALGIKQAIFLGFLAGYLNIIPYVGTLVGSIFPIIMALLFKDSMFYVIGVIAVFLFNQFIDNNITTPNVVGSHVQVNPLATIMSIIIGGIVWGIPGMILFIPLAGIFKIVCDNVDELKPIGYLMGENEKEKEKSTLFQKIKGIFKKKKA
ncbi:MAG: AI-2E family transporter [Cytophagaceae bacterium]|nr:AI-2E family transporter [Cytophagaceae bacterium]